MVFRIRKKKLFLALGILVAIICILGVWIYKNPSFTVYDGLEMSPSMDIADNLASSSQNHYFDSLLTSVGLDTFLHDQGPFTVFAPVDNSYANLPTDITDTLTTPEEEGITRSLVLYHIVKGQYLFKDLKDGMTLTTLEGEQLHIKKDKKGYWNINDQAYLQTYDIHSKNGVIHTINSYLIPKSIQP